MSKESRRTPLTEVRAVTSFIARSQNFASEHAFGEKRRERDRERTVH